MTQTCREKVKPVFTYINQDILFICSKFMYTGKLAPIIMRNYLDLGTLCPITVSIFSLYVWRGVKRNELWVFLIT